MLARLKPFAGPVMVVVLTVGAIVGGKRVLFPPGGGYVVNAQFRDVAGLTKNSEVKIGGVRAGTVKSMKLAADDTAMVKMELDKGAFPIGAGASAASRPVNLLGEKYVDLDPGNLSRPLRGGTTIPISRTSRPVEIDDVLNMLEPGVRARLRIVINEAGVAMAGRGTDLNTTIAQLPSALDQATKLVDSFSANNGQLASVISHSDRVLATITPKSGDLQGLADSAAKTLTVTAGKRRELADTVRAAPGGLRQLRGSLSQLKETAQRLEPFARQLRASAPPLHSVLTALPAFAAEARPALAAIRSTSPSVARLGLEARGPVRRLKPTSIALASFARQVAPTVESFDKEAMTNLLRLMAGWSSTIAKSDGLGHIFGLRILFDKTLVTSLLDRYVSTSVPAAKPAGKGTPRPASQPPDAVKDLLPEVPRPKLPVVKLPPLSKTGIGPIDKALADAAEAVAQRLPEVGGALGKVGPRSDRPSGAGSDVGTLFDYLVGP